MTTGHAERVRGSLLGGAVGDALGWPVEFQRLDVIRERFGPSGVTGPNGSEVTDDTQMTLFTAEGLLRGGTPAALKQAYQRWLLTQRLAGPSGRRTAGCWACRSCTPRGPRGTPA